MLLVPFVYPDINCLFILVLFIYLQSLKYKIESIKLVLFTNSLSDLVTRNITKEYVGGLVQLSGQRTDFRHS